MPRRVSSPHLIGRGDALEAVALALERAAAGDPGLVVVAGEAGVGKTRLAREACARAGDAGARVLWGGCVPLDAGELPYAPLVAALRPLSRELSEADDVLGPAREELNRLLPELGAAVAAVGPATPTSRMRLFELLLGVLARLAESAPVVLVVEDVHWADAATRDLLRFLARNVDHERLLLIATHRTDDPAAPDTGLLDHLLRSDRAERIALERLTREQTAEQVAGISGSPDDEIAAWAYERSEGNPFITEEVVAARAAGDGAGVPDTLRAVLLARSQGLPSAARRVLEVMATAGGAVRHGLLGPATGLDEPAIDDALHGLLRSHVIVRDATGERYAFRHALMREALYGELLAPERRARHAALADAIDAAAPAGARGPVEWAALAHHWDAGGDATRALGAALAAADAAVRAYAFADARRQLERARALWPRVAPADRPADVDEAELLCRLADAARLAGDSDGAIPIAEAALAALDRADERRVARLHLLLGKLHHAVAPALAHLERALELLPDEPSEDRAAVLVAILGALNYGELPSVARARALEALAVARAAGAVAEEAVVHHRLGSILAYGGDPEAGLAHLREAARLCAELGRVDEMAVALNDLGDALMLLGRIEEALGAFDEGLEDARRAGLARAGGVIIELNAADCELRLGRWPQTAARLARLRAGRMPDARDRLLLLVQAIYLAVRRGALNEATEDERQAIALLDANVGPQWIVTTTGARAELALARGEPAAVRELVEQTWVRIGKGDTLTWPAVLTLGLRAEADLAEEARARGDDAAVAEARTRAQPLLDEVCFYRFEEPVDGPGPPEALTHHALGAAELARLEGEPRPDLWADVAARWEEISHPYQAAYARLREAEAWLSIGGERSRAGAALRAAHRIAAELGAELVRRDAEALARRARLSLEEELKPDVPVAEPPLGLTPRELTVLELLSAGRTNRQIGEDLFLSRRTVDMHVRNVLAKLHVANRVEAAGIAHRLGLGTPA